MRIQTRHMKQRILWLIPVILAHSWLLLFEGRFWDDYVVLADIRGMAMERGMPIDWLWWQWASVHPRFWVFVLVIALFFAIERMCRILDEPGGAVHRHSEMIACLAMVFPAFKTWELLCTSNYLLYYLLFLVGWGYIIRLRPLVGLMLVLPGLFLKSLYPCHFLLAILAGKRNGREYFEVMTIVGLFCWLGQMVFFPSYGAYSGYHAFVWNPETILWSAKEFIRYGVLLR